MGPKSVLRFWLLLEGKINLIVIMITQNIRRLYTNNRKEIINLSIKYLRVVYSDVTIYYYYFYVV